MRDYLQKMRVERGLTQKDMGKKLGISESYYCCIEKGERQKKMDVVLAASLATVFGVPIARIYELETEFRGSA